MTVGTYGFMPVNLMGGQVYAGATRTIPIASGYAQNIGYGDLVGYDANGTIVRIDTTPGAKAAFAVKPVGIFAGCQYTQTNQPQYFLTSLNWVAGTVANNAVAIVVDDPDVVMKVALTNAGTQLTAGGATQAAVGLNIGYYEPATFVNQSGNSLASANLPSAAVTASLPFRIIDVVRETALPDGTFCEVLVNYNFGLHFYRQATGI